MARIRNIKPDFFEDENIAKLPFGARLLFIGLWTRCDLRGVFEWNLKVITAAVFPHDEDVDAKQVQEWFLELLRLGRVIAFEANGKKYGFVRHFSVHQAISKAERDSGPKYPAPPRLGSNASRSESSACDDPGKTIPPTVPPTVPVTVTKTPDEGQGTKDEGRGTSSNAREACPPAVSPPDMFEGMDQSAPPAVDGTVPKGFHDWRHRKLLGINSDDSSLAGWEALYRRQGWDEMTKGYQFVMQSKKPGQKCWLNDLLKLEA